MLGKLFRRPVQQTDMGIGAFDDFTVELEDCTSLFDTERYTGTVCAPLVITTVALPAASVGAGTLSIGAAYTRQVVPGNRNAPV